MISKNKNLGIFQGFFMHKKSSGTLQNFLILN